MHPKNVPNKAKFLKHYSTEDVTDPLAMLHAMVITGKAAGAKQGKGAIHPVSWCQQES